MNVSWRFIRMWQRNGDVFLKLWHSEVPAFVAEPVIVILAMGLGLGAFIGLVGGQQYIQFIVPGIVSAYAMFAASFECTYGTFFRMERQRTFDAIIATPLSVEDVIIGEIVWGATRAVLTGTAILAVAAAFQLVSSPWAVLVPLSSFLGGLMFSGIAMFFTSIVPSFYSFNYYYSLFITPMFFFSGVFFPLSSFPKVIQDFSLILPLTPVVHITRAILQGEFHADSLVSLGIIAAYMIIFSWLSLITMWRRMTV